MWFLNIIEDINIFFSYFYIILFYDFYSHYFYYHYNYTSLPRLSKNLILNYILTLSLKKYFFTIKIINYISTLSSKSNFLLLKI